MLGKHNMKMALPAYIPTLHSHSTGNHTRVDNVFCSEGILEAVVKCNMDDTTCPVKTDHYPIVTRINIHAPRVTEAPRRNFRLANWTELVKTLKENLANMPPPTEITNIPDFDESLKELNDAIQDAINKHVKMSKPSPYSK
jgi:hypothetical protein